MAKQGDPEDPRRKNEAKPGKTTKKDKEKNKPSKGRY